MNWKLISTRKLNLWYISVLYKGMRDDMKDLLGCGYSNILDVSENQTIRSHVLEKDIKTLGDILVQKIKKDKNFMEKLVNDYESRAKKLLKLSNKISTENLSKLSDKKLLELYENFSRLYQSMGPYLDIPNTFADIGMKELKRISNIEDKYIGILASPTEKSYVAQEEQEFLEIALKNGNINKHIKKWCWINFYESGKVLDKKYYEDLLNKVKNNQKESKERLEEIKGLPKKIKQEQKKVLKKIKISKEALVLLKAFQLITALKDRRRAVFTKADYESVKLFEEIAKRMDISMIELRHLLTEEASEMFLSKKINKDLIESRLKYYVYLMKNNVVNVYTNGEAKKIEESELKQEKIETELKGVCASPGKATGKVVKIQAMHHLSKVKDGDIMVSKFTNPNYIMAIKKAVAIITEEGGITSHAAILSREMNIPCIVGVKDALKILEDGEEITIDADNGLIIRRDKDEKS